MPDRLLAPLQRTLAGRNALLNTFELWVGLAGVISGIVFLYAPASIDNNALAKTMGYALAAVWTVSYMGAGVGIWVGLLKPSPRVEVAALWLLGGATCVNCISVLHTFGVRAVATALTLLALTLASWVRALFVQSAALKLARDARRAAP